MKYTPLLLGALVLASCQSYDQPYGKATVQRTAPAAEAPIAVTDEKAAADTDVTIVTAAPVTTEKAPVAETPKPAPARRGGLFSQNQVAPAVAPAPAVPTELLKDVEPNRKVKTGDIKVLNTADGPVIVVPRA